MNRYVTCEHYIDGTMRRIIDSMAPDASERWVCDARNSETAALICSLLNEHELKHLPPRRLNRTEAMGAIDGAEEDALTSGTLASLLKLQRHWMGHESFTIEPTFEKTVRSLADGLEEFVNTMSAMNNEGCGGSASRGTDPTGLTLPEGW